MVSESCIKKDHKNFANKWDMTANSPSARIFFSYLSFLYYVRCATKRNNFIERAEVAAKSNACKQTRTKKFMQHESISDINCIIILKMPCESRTK